MTLLGIVVVTVLVALADWWMGGFKEPWRKIIFIALVIALIIAVLATLGLLPRFGPIVLW